MENFEKELSRIISMKGHLTSDILEIMLKKLAKDYNMVIRWRDRDVITGKVTIKIIGA